MSKFDLWKDCPYWPKHRFKKDVCLECGFRKPQRPNMTRTINPMKSTLEYRINKILLLRQEIASFDYSWPYDPVNLADVYDGYTVSGCFGEGKLTHPSSPLKGERKKAKRRLSKVARLIEFYEKAWPIVKKTLDEILAERHLKPKIRRHVERFLRSQMFFKHSLTKNQTEQLVAAYTYFYSGLPERKVAEEPDALFPNVTRKTLRRWVEFVKKFERMHLG